jgi:hypothetical protein
MTPIDELVPTFIIPYTIQEDDYGDGGVYARLLDEGELTAPDQTLLAQEIEALCTKTILGWGRLSDRPNLYHLENYDLPSLSRFKPSVSSGDVDRWRDLAQRNPRSGFSYVVFGQIRIEMRHADGSKPDLDFEDQTIEHLCAVMRKAHVQAAADLAKATTDLRGASTAATRRRKEEELAKLKAELGVE